MDSRQLLAEALQLSDEERAALAGELIQSLEHEVGAEAEAAWSAEIRTRQPSVALDLEYLEEAVVEAATAAEWS